MRTFVIAEAGASHDTNKTWAIELVYIAKAAGADAIKFQFVSDPDEYAKRRKVPKEYRESYRKYALKAEWLDELHAIAKRQGLIFGCSVFLPKDVDQIEPYVDFFKVASFEASAPDLLRAYAPFLGKARALFVSLGMGASAGDTYKASGGLPAGSVKFLHCVSGYPTPMKDLNLGRIREAELDGFSDHSGNVETGAMAVTAGAKIIEAHLRLDCTAPENPDYPHALSPDRFAQYVANIRAAERALGNGKNEVQESERQNVAFKVGAGDSVEVHGGEKAGEAEDVRGTRGQGAASGGRPAKTRE